ncbi:M15 family metallopeptidase [Streptomyces sp. NPDC098789]|uniref:M15 family metallopeptidase n=1 Tax=Streptomyces sp. NPDC098789 TaxID=3366098 RepID=UPI0037FCA64C
MAPEEFVVLTEVDPMIGTDIRYATHRNFVGVPLDGYLSPTCILTRRTAWALSRARAALSGSGYTLQVLDAYRPIRAVRHVTRWARDLDDQRTKQEFYPRTAKERLFPDGYLYEWSSHSRGGSVDVTLVTTAGAPVDMGTAFGCFDARSRTLHPGVRGVRRSRRALLERAMAQSGFVNRPGAWWHYTYASEPFPDVYFDFPVSESSLSLPAPVGLRSPVLPAQRSGNAP